MKLCDDGHEEVCYEGNRCPACEALNELAEAKEQIEARDGEIAELRDNLAATQEG